MKPQIRRALVAATTLAFASFGCTTEEEKPRIVASPVFVVAATEVDVTDHIEATGELLAKDDASVAAQVGGAITETLIEEGSSVAAGDVVALLMDNREEFLFQVMALNHLGAVAALINTQLRGESLAHAFRAAPERRRLARRRRPSRVLGPRRERG